MQFSKNREIVRERVLFRSTVTTSLLSVLLSFLVAGRPSRDLNSLNQTREKIMIFIFKLPSYLRVYEYLQ